MCESCQNSLSMATWKQTFFPFASTLNTNVILNDSTPNSMHSLINMLWSYLSVFIWNWWLVLMKSKMFVTQCQVTKVLCYFVLEIAVLSYMPTIHMNVSYLPNMWQLLKSNHSSSESSVTYGTALKSLCGGVVSVCGGGGVNVSFCKQSKYWMTAHGIWNECFNKVYIVFTFKNQLSIWFVYYTK